MMAEQSRESTDRIVSVLSGTQSYVGILEEAIALIVATAKVVQDGGGLPSSPEIDEMFDSIAGAKALLDNN